MPVTVSPHWLKKPWPGGGVPGNQKIPLDTPLTDNTRVCVCLCLCACFMFVPIWNPRDSADTNRCLNHHPISREILDILRRYEKFRKISQNRLMTLHNTQWCRRGRVVAYVATQRGHKVGQSHALHLVDPQSRPGYESVVEYGSECQRSEQSLDFWLDLSTKCPTCSCHENWSGSLGRPE